MMKIIKTRKTESVSPKRALKSREEINAMLNEKLCKDDISTDELKESDADRPLRVCRSCLMGIEAHEGRQHVEPIYVDEDDVENSKCDWCEEEGFDVLYELV